MPNLESALCVNKVRHQPDHSQKAKLLVLYCRCKACPKLKYIVSLLNRTMLYMEVLKSGEHEFENHDKEFKSRNNKKQRVDVNGQDDLKTDQSVYDYYQNEANCVTNQQEYTDFDGESYLDFDEDEQNLESDSSMLNMSKQPASGTQRKDVIQHITDSDQSVINSNSVDGRVQVEQTNGNKSDHASSFNQSSAESGKMYACCIECDAKIEGDLGLRFSDRVRLIHMGEECSLVINVLTDKCGYVPNRCIQLLSKFLENIRLCQKNIATMSN